MTLFEALITALFIVAVLVIILLISHNQKLKKENNLLNDRLDEASRIVKDLNTHVSDLKASENLLRTMHFTRAKIMSVISHNVKGPLKYIHHVSNFIDKNWDTLSSSELKKSSVSIMETSHSLYDLVDNVLNWSKQQNAEIQFNPERFRVRDLINEELRIQGPLFGHKTLTAENHIDETFELIADKHLLRLILQNIFSNAIKFSKEGGTIRVKARANGSTTSVLIEDEGVGMSKREIDRIFDINDYYTRPGTANEKGNGIGLLIIQDLISLHGGNVQFRSRPSKGTTVELQFPLQEK